MDIAYSENITTIEDMLTLKGIDLNVELSNGINDVGDSPALRAINDVEEWLINYINLNYDFKGDRADLSDFQKKFFKKAVCEQIDYILDNGDLRNLSGINRNTGFVIDKKVIQDKELSPSAYMFLRRCGLANLLRY